ncbi:condensation protein [Paracoccus sp. R12_1]|uniref:condensation domain-containing protein n=1 Tax=unclassified Paracoccus (in: a-proteobacteria) TaxID=2688777 RepID=UPI001AD97448|nr:MULTISPECIES: condensation domain-containing protein [unclassified Paracoccus (in: a-proteobacteria)]MBO9456727.1 condensation protein [Paracoccus sp. R12_2]MBO9487823.1 condensation protein [Paracoccus sp. R12_1]
MASPRQRTEWLPLTLGQLDFWQEYRAHRGKSVSTVAHLTRLHGDLDHAALSVAIRDCIAESDVMCLRFRERDGIPEQMIDPALAPVLREMDLRGETDPDGRARSMMQEDLDRPLDLLTGPLVAQWLVRTGDKDCMWYCRGHHIFLDGYSMALIERRVARLYAHHAGGDDPGDPFLPFPEYLREESEYRVSDRHASDGAFWQDRIAEAPRLVVLDKGSEDYPQTQRCAETDLHHLSAPLQSTGERFAMGWPDMLTLLTGLWLWGHPESDRGRAFSERVIWLPFQSRMGCVGSRIPAMAVNILPFRVTADPTHDLTETLRTMARDLRKHRRHGRYRIEQITLDQSIAAGRRYFFSPLINVMPFDPPRLPGADIRQEVLAAGPGDGFNIGFAADSRGDGLMLYLEADPRLTSDALFRHHTDGLPRFLQQCLCDDDGAATLQDLLRLSPA